MATETVVISLRRRNLPLIGLIAAWILTPEELVITFVHIQKTPQQRGFSQQSCVS